MIKLKHEQLKKISNHLFIKFRYVFETMQTFMHIKEKD